MMTKCPQLRLKVMGAQVANNPPHKPTPPATVSGPRPGDFPLGSRESRAATRFALNARKAGRSLFHIEVVGSDRPCLDCPCSDCRHWWETHPKEHADEELKLHKFLNSFNAVPIQRQERVSVVEQRKPEQAEVKPTPPTTVEDYCEQQRLSQAPAGCIVPAPQRREPQTRTGRTMQWLRARGEL